MVIFHGKMLVYQRVASGELGKRLHFANRGISSFHIQDPAGAGILMLT